MKLTLDWHYDNFKTTCPHYSNSGVIKFGLNTEFVKSTSAKSHMPIEHAKKYVLSHEQH